MSTGTRMPLVEALAHAEAFAALFAGCFLRWEIAGSIRRGKPDVGDCEHVVQAAKSTMPGLFDQPVESNALWDRADALVADRTCERAIYPDGSERWGDKYRGLVFRGVRHEVFTADGANWGAILTIRTGPADFSKRLVTQLLAGGLYRQQDGYVVNVRDGSRRAMPTERDFFAACGEPWAEPEDRA